MDHVHELRVRRVQPHELRHGLEQRLRRVQPGDPAQSPDVQELEVLPGVAADVGAQAVPDEVKVSRLCPVSRLMRLKLVFGCA